MVPPGIPIGARLAAVHTCPRQGDRRACGLLCGQRGAGRSGTGGHPHGEPCRDQDRRQGGAEVHASTCVHLREWQMTAAGAQVVDGAAVTKTAEVLRVAVAGNGDDLTEESVTTLVISSPSERNQVILEATRLGAGRLRLALGPGDEAAAHTAAAWRALVARGFDVVVETAAPGAAEPVLVPAAAWLAVLGLPVPELPGAPADAPAPPTAPVPTRAFPATDTGNAERLAAAFGADLRHTGTTWVVWDGRRWAEDRTGGEIARRAKATVRTIRAEASTCTNETAARALDRWGGRFGEPGPAVGHGRVAPARARPVRGSAAARRRPLGPQLPERDH